MRPSPLTSALLLVSTLGLLNALPVRADHQTDTHRFEEVADGVYFVSEVGAIYLMSNAMVVVNEEDVLVVDSHVTPAAADALIASIKTFTDKPITTLVNTHYHFDHAHGNQSFGPEVEIIGHEYTYQKLSGNPLEERTYVGFSEIFDQRLAGLKESAEKASGEERAELEKQADVIAAYIEASKDIRPTPPTITLERQLTLHRGGREIQLHFLGRGHTGGDVVVLLPKEKILFTGDVLLPSFSYMGDGYVNDWSATLERIKALDFDLILPGHGRPFNDPEHIGHLQDYYGDLWKETAALKDQGLSAEEAALRIDLIRNAGRLKVEQRGADLRAVARIYELLDGAP